MPDSSSDANTRTRDRAVALQYSDPDELPRLLASGAGALAARIRELAERHNIPIAEDPKLTDLLFDLDVGEEISRETFRLVAEIIVFLYHVDEQWRRAHPELDRMIPELQSLDQERR